MAMMLGEWLPSPAPAPAALALGASGSLNMSSSEPPSADERRRRRGAIAEWLPSSPPPELAALHGASSSRKGSPAFPGGVHDEAATRRDRIECAICLEPARSPRPFPHPDCRHMYCATCLASLRGRSPGTSTTCPQCRRPATPCRSEAGTLDATSPVTPVARPTVSSHQLQTERRQRTLRLLLEPLDVAPLQPQQQQRRPQTALITQTGAKYHLSSSCRGLRNASRVWQGSTHGKEPCKLCTGTGTDVRSPTITGECPRQAPAVNSTQAGARHFTTRTGKAFHRSRTCAGLCRATAIFESLGTSPTGAQRRYLQPCKLCCR